MKRLTVIALCLFLLFPVGIVVSQNQPSVNSQQLANAVDIDGEWTTSEEWVDSTELKIDEVGYIRIKDTSTKLYVLIDFLMDTELNEGDYASVVLDTGNDKGSMPRPDDHQIRIRWTNTYGLAYAVEYTYGTDQGWANYRQGFRGFEGASSIDASNDPYSTVPHLIYEFELTKTIVAEYANVAGIFIGAFDTRGNTLSWPPTSSQDNPDTYGAVIFAVPIPEFQSSATGSIAVWALLVTCIFLALLKSLRSRSSINKFGKALSQNLSRSLIY